MSVSPPTSNLQYGSHGLYARKPTGTTKPKTDPLELARNLTDGSSFPHTQKKKEGKGKIYYFDTKNHFPSLAFNALNAIFSVVSLGKEK